MTSPAPETLFGDVVAYIERARGMLSRGEWVEMKGLDSDIAALCSALSGLSLDQAREYLPELEFLRDQMEALENDMKSVRDQVVREMQGAGTLQRANRAYAEGQNLDHPAKGAGNKE